MTDNEIIKALEKITAYKSLNIRTRRILHYVIDLIYCLKNNAKKDNRIIKLQDKKIAEQQAEIERLKAEADMADGYAEALIQNAKTEAIKEFADMVKTLWANNDGYAFERKFYKLVKEKTEEKENE